MKIKDISRIKGREVITVKANSTLSEAIEKMVNNSIGALPVCEADEKLVGVISERDILRSLYQRSNDIGTTRIRDVMTKDVIVGVPDDDVESTLKIMSDKGIRHLPVMSGEKIVGMLSIRDVIEEKLTECNTQVRYLHDYIAGGPSQ